MTRPHVSLWSNLPHLSSSQFWPSYATFIFFIFFPLRNFLQFTHTLHNHISTQQNAAYSPIYPHSLWFTLTQQGERLNYGLNDRGIEVWVPARSVSLSLLQSIHSGSWARQLSIQQVLKAPSLRSKTAGVLKLTACFHIVQRLKKYF